MNNGGCLGAVIGLVLLGVGVAVGALAAGTGLEIMAMAFEPLGAFPEAGWGLAGLVLGAGLGAIVGLRRAGRKKQTLEWVLFAALVVGLLLLGWGRADAELYASSSQADAESYVTVTTENLNVRPFPSTSNTPITSVPWGFRMREIGREDRWVQVQFLGDDGYMVTGWVSGELIQSE